MGIHITEANSSFQFLHSAGSTYSTGKHPNVNFKFFILDKSRRIILLSDGARCSLLQSPLKIWMAQTRMAPKVNEIKLKLKMQNNGFSSNINFVRIEIRIRAASA